MFCPTDTRRSLDHGFTPFVRRCIDAVVSFALLEDVSSPPAGVDDRSGPCAPSAPLDASPRHRRRPGTLEPTGLSCAEACTTGTSDRRRRQREHDHVHA